MTDADSLLQEDVSAERAGDMTMSIAMLTWFLLNVWRVEPEDVDDLVCDGGGDKGIDALVVNEDLQEITVFQGKWRDDPSKTTQGDSDLKSLVGAASYFETADTVQALIDSKPNQELKNLIVRHDVKEKIRAGEYSVALIFVTNADLDSSGQGYVDTRNTLTPPLEVWDRHRLQELAARARKPDLRPELVALPLVSPPTTTELTKSERIAICIVAARELVKLPGLDDNTLFNRNVRLFAGRTKINKDLAETVEDRSEHRLFPAYHNGLTLLTGEFSIDEKEIKLDGVGVVNGCQSLLTLKTHTDDLTDSLVLVVKVVEIEKDGQVSDKITYRSNNQNAVTIRDQRSSDVIMRDLKAGVRDKYGTNFALTLRVGEQSNASRVLENTLAAQLIMAAYRRLPWSAVRKVRLFDQDYRMIFARDITPDKLLLLTLIHEAVTSRRSHLRSDLRSSFASVKFTIVYLVAELLRQKPAGQELLENPGGWLPELESAVAEQLSRLAYEVIDSVNYHVKSEINRDSNYDPKVKFKSQDGVQKLENDVLRDAARQEDRGDAYYFSVSPKA